MTTRKRTVVSEEVRATKFTLVDEDGRTRAELSTDRDGPGLCMFGPTGKLRAELKGASTPFGPSLRLLDEDGKVRAMLAVNDDGEPSLRLFDGAERPRERAVLVLVGSGDPHLYLSDENSRTRAELTLDAVGDSALHLLDGGEIFRAGLEVTSDGPRLYISDATGETIWSVPEEAQPDVLPGGK